MKARLGIPPSDYNRDAQLDLIVEEASALVEAYLARGVQRKTDLVEYLNVDENDQRIFRLRYWPVDSVTEVRYDLDRVFGSGTVEDSDDYAVDADTGLLQVDFGVLRSTGTLKVTYSGGMGSTVDELSQRFPAVVTAANMQAAFMALHVNDVGTQSSSAGQGAGKSYRRPGSGGLIEEVQNVLKSLRRV